MMFLWYEGYFRKKRILQFSVKFDYNMNYYDIKRTNRYTQMLLLIKYKFRGIYLQLMCCLYHSKEKLALKQIASNRMWLVMQFRRHSWNSQWLAYDEEEDNDDGEE